MPYQLLGQVTVDWAVVIYGFCHFWLANLVQTKTIQFAVDFLLSFLLHRYTISNKSQRLVRLSPRLCCWARAWALGCSPRRKGRRQHLNSGWRIERAVAQTNRWPSGPGSRQRNWAVVLLRMTSSASLCWTTSCKRAAALPFFFFIS